MIRDLFSYMRLRINDRAVGREKRKKIKYPFQRMVIAAALALWSITAVNVLYSDWGVSGKDKIISAFGSMTDTDVSSSVSAYGKYGEVAISDNAKKLILEDIAEKIGINKYTITDMVDEEYNAVKTLSQTSVNGDVIIKFITHDVSQQYIYIGISLKNGIDSAFTYEEIVKEILKKLEMDTPVNVNLKGEVYGKLDANTKDTLADALLGKLGAKIVTQNRADDMYVIYAYDDDLKDYINVGQGKVNVNLSITYDETRNRTCIYLATPMNNQDF